MRLNFKQISWGDFIAGIAVAIICMLMVKIVLADAPEIWTDGRAHIYKFMDGGKIQCYVAEASVYGIDAYSVGISCIKIK